MKKSIVLIILAAALVATATASTTLTEPAETQDSTVLKFSAPQNVSMTVATTTTSSPPQRNRQPGLAVPRRRAVDGGRHNRALHHGNPLGRHDYRHAAGCRPMDNNRRGAQLHDAHAASELRRRDRREPVARAIEHTRTGASIPPRPRPRRLCPPPTPKVAPRPSTRASNRWRFSFLETNKERPRSLARPGPVFRPEVSVGRPKWRPHLFSGGNLFR